MTSATAPPIAVLPAGTREFATAAVEAGGGRLVDAAEAEALVWTAVADRDGLGRVLDENPQLRWVQLPFAGVEPYIEVIQAHGERTWT